MIADTENDSTNPQNPTRIVLIISDAAIAHSSMGHDRIQARVSHGNAAMTAGRLGTADESVDRSISAVLLFNLGVALASDVEKHSGDGSSSGENTNDNTSSNTCNIGTALLWFWRLRGDRCLYDGGTATATAVIVVVVVIVAAVANTRTCIGRSWRRGTRFSYTSDARAGGFVAADLELKSDVVDRVTLNATAGLWGVCRAWLIAFAVLNQVFLWRQSIATQTLSSMHSGQPETIGFACIIAGSGRHLIGRDGLVHRHITIRAIAAR